ncbi:MAG: ABC transporter permease [Ligilactobacillus agilis]|nr:ABC transporter permease [Ligilactobacillus agilis]
MNKVIAVAKMVFKKRSLSPTYYWMIFAPIIFLIVGIGFARYIQHQTKAERPVIAVVANENIKKALIEQKSSAYQINQKIVSNDPKRLQMYLADGVLDGILEVNDDFSKVTYRYNADSQATVPIKTIQNNLASLRAQSVALKYGLSAKQWINITQIPTVKKEILNQKATVNLKNSEMAQNFSEAVVMIAFFFLTSYISITGAELGNEKGNHLIEGVIAAIPAKKHFAGKMLGIAWLVILQIFIYCVLFVITYLGLKETKFQFMTELRKYWQYLDASYMLIVVLLTIFALASYVFLAACLASFVSRIEDISQATTSVASIMLIPYFISFLTQTNPNLLLAKVLSYLPFMSQGIMPVRLAQGAVAYQNAWLAVLISLFGAMGMYFIAEKTYVKNVFAYSSNAPLQVLWRQLAKAKR